MFFLSDVTRGGKAPCVRTARSTQAVSMGPAPSPGRASVWRDGADKCATRTSTSAPTTDPVTTEQPASTRARIILAPVPLASQEEIVKLE